MLSSCTPHRIEWPTDWIHACLTVNGWLQSDLNLCLSGKWLGFDARKFHFPVTMSKLFTQRTHTQVLVLVSTGKQYNLVLAKGRWCSVDGKAACLKVQQPIPLCFLWPASPAGCLHSGISSEPPTLVSSMTAAHDRTVYVVSLRCV